MTIVKQSDYLNSDGSVLRNRKTTDSMISVLILTKDEETNIEKCLRSVSWCDDVHVLDSFSSDGTVDIAKSMGAKVTQRVFDNWSSHQNWAVSCMEFKYPWVLHLDADEVCDQLLTDEILRVATVSANEVAYRMRRKDYFMDTWLRRSQIYPTWLIRLFRPSRITYQRLINPTVHPDGPVGTLRGHIIHDPFSHGIDHWIARHNNYSTLEAIEFLKSCSDPVSLKELLNGDPESRRKAWKQFVYKLPFRPALFFFYLYFLRLGFLDGTAGYYYSRLRAAYELMIDVKVSESRYQRRTTKEAIDTSFKKAIS